MKDCKRHFHDCEPPSKCRDECDPKGFEPIAPFKIPPRYDQICSVVEGMSLYESQNAVIKRINAVSCEFNEVMCKAEGTLARLEACGKEEGGYYHPCDVWTEEGYDVNEQSHYTVTHINSRDKRGVPIKMKMHLAYGNTTNSNQREGAFEASFYELADKMVGAIPVRDDGWFGLAVHEGRPIPSTMGDPEKALYTVGFNDCGRMFWYTNTGTYDTLRRDKIRDAMGVYGILVHKGEVTPTSMYNKVPYYDVKKARVVMGQRPHCKGHETIIITCGGYETEFGMTTARMAELLKEFGCETGVELVQADSAVALDKGKLQFMPDNADVPELTAFWYISKKPCFKKKSQRELAELYQLYGWLLWQMKLNRRAIEDLRDRMDAVEARLDSLEERMDAAEAAIKDLQNRVAVLEEKVAALEAEVIRLDSEIKRVEAESKARDEVLQGNIDALRTWTEGEINRIDGEITNIKSELVRVETESKERDQALRDDLDALTETVAQLRRDLDALDARESAHYNEIIARFQVLETRVNEIDNRLASLQETVAAMDTTITSILKSIDEIKQALLELEQMYTALVDRVTSLETRMDTAETDIANLKVCCANGKLARRYSGTFDFIEPVRGQRYGLDYVITRTADNAFLQLNFIADIDDLNTEVVNGQYIRDIDLTTMEWPEAFVVSENVTLSGECRLSYWQVSYTGFPEVPTQSIPLPRNEWTITFSNGRPQNLHIEMYTYYVNRSETPNPAVYNPPANMRPWFATAMLPMVNFASGEAIDYEDVTP